MMKTWFATSISGAGGDPVEATVTI